MSSLKLTSGCEWTPKPDDWNCFVLLIIIGVRASANAMVGIVARQLHERITLTWMASSPPTQNPCQENFLGTYPSTLFFLKWPWFFKNVMQKKYPMLLTIYFEIQTTWTFIYLRRNLALCPKCGLEKCARWPVSMNGAEKPLSLLPEEGNWSLRSYHIKINLKWTHDWNASPAAVSHWRKMEKAPSLRSGQYSFFGQGFRTIGNNTLKMEQQIKMLLHSLRSN